MQITQEQAELEQAQAVLDEALGDLKASRDSSAAQSMGLAASSEPAANADLLAERASLALARQAWEANQKGAEEELKRLNAQLEERERRLEAIASEHDQMASRLERRTAELREQFAEFERQQTAFQNQIEAGPRQPQAANPAAEEPQPADEPEEESRAFVTRNRRQADAAHEPQDDSLSSESDEQPSLPRRGETRRNAPLVEAPPEEDEPDPKPLVRAARTPVRGTDEDQSIEQYMAGLLNRMRGGNDAGAVITPERKPVSQEEAAPAAPEVPVVVAPVEPVIRAQRVIDVHMAPVEMERRTSAPGEANDLAAMRELANTHARTAIDIHGKQQLLKTAVATWAAGIGAAGASLVGFCILSADEVVMRSGCMMGFVASSYWIFKAVMATRELLAATTASNALRNLRRAAMEKSGERKKPA